MVVAAALLARIIGAEPLERAWERARGMLVAPEGRLFALAVAAAAGLAAATVAALVHGRAPTSVDEMVQLLHAHALVEGRLALPLPGPPAAWNVQNGLLTPEGWAAVYPPGHTAALALGLALGAAWLVGPLAVGATAGLTTAGLERLWGRGGRARVAGVALVVSPFLLLLGSTHLSHATAGALAALAFWAATRALERPPRAAWLTGVAVGALVCTRPWTGVALSGALLGSLWAPRGIGWTSRRLGWVALGGAPFALALFAWNRQLFGGAWTLGYAAAYGPAHGLGLHVDPWGNRYGMLEALGYTGADLTLLGAHLFESPLPVTVLVAAWLILGGGTPLRARAVAWWAGAGLAANALYWHHGIHMGPRMLFETAPAWIALSVAAAAGLARTGAPRARAMVVWVLALTLAGSTLLAPLAARAYRGAVAVARAPAPPGRPALVFAHGSWASRIAARAAAAGMRRDSVETLLRRNDVCVADAYARWRAGTAEGPPPRVDLAPLAGSPPELSPRELSPGNRVRVDPARAPSAACAREAASDRLGTVELEPLLWTAPPVPDGETWVVRDLGPVENLRLIERHGGRHAYVLVGANAAPRLLPYEEGMDLLWRGAAGVSPAGR